MFGSTKNATAGPASDIDLLLHVEPEDDAPPRARGLARGLEPGAGRGELPAHRLPDRRPARRPLRDRRGHRSAAPASPPRSAPSPTPPGRCRWPRRRPSAGTAETRLARANVEDGRRAVADVDRAVAGQLEPATAAAGSPRRGAPGRKRTSASSGPSCAAERQTVRPMRLAPGAGEPRRLVHVAVQGDERLARLDEAADRDACRRAGRAARARTSARRARRVEGRAVRRRVEQEHGARRLRRCREPLEVGRDRAPPRVELVDGNRAPPLLRRDAARVDVARDVVALPVLEQERRRRHAGVAADGEARDLDAGVVCVPQQAAASRARASDGSSLRGSSLPKMASTARIGSAEPLAQRLQSRPQPVDQEGAAV